MQNTDFLMTLIFTHLLGDFVFQTSKLAESKAKSIKGLLIHVLIVFTVNIVFLFNYGLIGEIAALITTATHFIIDYAKMKTKIFYKITSIHSVIDQIIHFVVIISCDYFFRNMTNQPIMKLGFIGILNYFIIITYVATVIAKMVLCDICECKQVSCDFFKKYERLFDCTIILAIVFSFINTILGIIVLVIATVVFYFVENNYFKYSKQQTILKATIYLIFAWAFRFLVI
ncbi:DUF3307 domain-containing protein [Ruminiclostridium herbifermentans]|uniref:DUF3307 domain-containing protein n=1 Tax=Ruminiclostridium herbifermentans TaxID=2488810 RepID=A0A4U7JFC8_9FIRM|nr:DUF3307 domain-containing protein [Ruminiclostridium herbifermentans]QNU67407.1 DUF3307 domain-containing protein [Ruminiclostridium herbifermentans]